MSKKNNKNNSNCNCEENKDCHCNETQECNCHEEEHTCENNHECSCHNQEDDTNELLSNRIKNLEDALLRSQAELQNYRKRKDEETARILKYAEEDVLKGFLPILDNFERAIKMDDNNFGDETSKFLEGFRMVYNQTKELLKKFEVKEIDCLNKEFDPATEQAIATEKKEGIEPGIVIKVYQKGYMYKDKVLRTAMVIVSE